MTMATAASRFRNGHPLPNLDMLRSEVVHACEEALLEVPGLSALRTTARMGIKTWHVACEMQGWSPSLHRTAMRWTAGMKCPPDDQCGGRAAGLRRSVRTMFADELRTQGDLAAKAARLGIREPLEMVSAATAAGSGGVRMDHVLIDRHLLAMVVGVICDVSDDGMADGESLSRQLAFDMATAHEDCIGDGASVKGTNLLRKLETTVSTHRAPDGGVEALLRPTHVLHGGSPLATFDGMRLVVLSALPETAAAAARGRPVGDVVATSTSIDRRRVASIVVTDKATAMLVEPDPVRIGDIPDRPVTVEDILAMPDAWRT